MMKCGINDGGLGFFGSGFHALFYMHYIVEQRRVALVQFYEYVFS